MDIWIPKYKEIIVRGQHPSTRISLKGEYRARLYGADGRMKSDTGWKPNTLLNNGLRLMAYETSSTSSWAKMGVGDSDVAVDITQTGLQGTPLATGVSCNALAGGTNSGAPDYIRVTRRRSTFAAGVGTGTIKEFACGRYSGAEVSNAMCRVVLTAPIVKGPSDSLDIEHRLTHYQDTVDKTGVVNIDGTDYNWLMRIGGAASLTNDHVTTVRPPDTSSWEYAYSDEIGSIEDSYPAANIGGWAGAGISVAAGGGLGTYYAEKITGAGVDNCNGLIRCYAGRGIYPSTIKIRLGKVSDDTAFLKENTHELVLTFRQYPIRYVP